MATILFVYAPVMILCCYLVGLMIDDTCKSIFGNDGTKTYCAIMFTCVGVYLVIDLLLA